MAKHSESNRSRLDMGENKNSFFSREILRILGWTDLQGDVNIDGLAETVRGIPTLATYHHEDVHRRLITCSALGHFQRLLFRLVQSKMTPEEHRSLYNRVLNKCIDNSILTHEGIATYVMRLVFLMDYPEDEQRFLNALPETYATAFDLVRKVLPNPVALEGDMERFCSYAACAQFTGTLLCCGPLLSYYRAWRRLKKAHLRYIDYETPDDVLKQVAAERPGFSRKLEQFVEYAERTGKKLVTETIMETRHSQQLLQEQWMQWNEEYFNLVLCQASIDG